MKKKKTIGICFLILIFLILGCVGFLGIQKYIFFHPRNDIVAFEELKNTTNVEEVNINNSGNNLNGWLYYNTQEGEKKPLVIFFQGNAQCSSNTMLAYLNQGVFDYFSGYNVLVVDYPGYGYSEGEPGEKEMFDAANAIYQWAIQQSFVDNDNIVILGYSIGTGVATYCASKNKVNGLILVAPYDKAISLYNNAINMFYGPLRMLAKYRFDSLSYAKDIDFEVQVITSYDDEVINYKFSQNLSDNFKKHKDILILDNGVTHSDYFHQEEVLEVIKEYLLERLN